MYLIDLSKGVFFLKPPVVLVGSLIFPTKLNQKRLPATNNRLLLGHKELRVVALLYQDSVLLTIGHTYLVPVSQ